jgi:hypothetical protein
MSGLGRYHFLAWGRRGLAATLTNTDTGGPLPARASLDIELGVNGTAAPGVTAQLYGPIDVVGLIAQHVVRTEPKPFTANFEPNYLAGIEFDQFDLPWLFTPAAPSGDRIRPWLALIALKDDEFAPVAGAPNPLPAIDVSNIAALQPLDDAWNWAHMQVSGDQSDLAGALAAQPGLGLSRILCPRRLDPETAYTAFVVPAFDGGRLAGLNQDVSAVTTLAPAWTATSATPLRLPFYFSFAFHTSDQGDFESLVRRMTPRVLGPEIGMRLMNVDDPEPGIPSAGTPLGLQGALQSLEAEATNWTGSDKDAFQTTLQTLINMTTASNDDPANPNPDDPRVVPPLYGHWHAAVLAADRTQPGWFNELNLDPRPRTYAGFGTEIVQDERTQLIASAWAQLPGLDLANTLLKQAQLARDAMVQLYTQHFVPLASATLLNVTAPLHAKLLASPQTIRATVAASRVPLRLFSGAFRRVARPLGALRRRQGAAGKPISAILTRLNANEIAIVAPAKPPAGMQSIEAISDSLVPPWMANLPPWLRRFLLPIAIAVLIAFALIALAMGPIGWIAMAIVGGVLWSQRNQIFNALQSERVAEALRLASFTAASVAAVPPAPTFAIAAAGVRPSTGSTTATGDSPDAIAFRGALTDYANGIAGAAFDAPLGPELEIDALRGTIVTKTDPRITVPARAISRLRYIVPIVWKPADPIAPIMNAPSFPQPMYAPLRDLSPQYVLPGVDLIPPETLGLLETNHAFVEAYMVGLNHEMSRQLLWNGYPSDLRGSYFRQFWDVSNYVPQAGDPTDPAALAEKLKDIPPINTWPLSGALGTNENRTDVAPTDVVLLIRGELLRRYPNTIIYAAKATINDQQERVIDDSDERYPIFGGTLPGDITFVGFNLSPQDAKGGTAAAPQGFFFVFQQQPSEPRFGLEPTATATVTHWADLAWTNFGGGSGTGGAPPTVRGVSATSFVTEWASWRLASSVLAGVMRSSALPDFLHASLGPIDKAIVDDSDDPNDTANAWGVDAAQTAYILFRLPFRVAVHADMMIDQMKATS